MTTAQTTEELHSRFELNPDPKTLTGHSNELPRVVSKDVDYEPRPEKSLSLSPEQQSLVQNILNLSSGSSSEEDMQAIYDDPSSSCDTRYKIAGQWYGLPKVLTTLLTISTEVVSNTPTEIVFKLCHEYTPKLLHAPKAVGSLVSLSLDDEGKVRYHKDMWNEKDYSHEGLGKVFKKLNGDHLTRVTKPPEHL